MANKIQLEIVSPEKVVYSTEVNMLIVRSTDGELGILPNHAPLIAGLVPATMRLLTDEGEDLVAVSGGFIEVQPKKITVLATHAELPADIDIKRAKDAYSRALARIMAAKGEGTPVAKDNGDIDMVRAQAALDRAKARLKATKQSMPEK